MGKINMHIECAKCGRAIERAAPCPSCGSINKKFYVECSDTVTCNDGAGIKLFDRLGFLKLSSIIRNKISMVSRRPAKEILTFDRTDSNVTKKYHHVEETKEDGSKEVVHHEEIDFPAKHRPQHGTT